MQRLLPKTFHSLRFCQSIHQSGSVLVRRYSFAKFARNPVLTFNNQFVGSSLRRMSNGDPHASKNKITDKINGILSQSQKSVLFSSAIVACIALFVAFGGADFLAERLADMYFNNEDKKYRKYKQRNLQKFVENNKRFLESKDGECVSYYIERPLLVKQLKKSILKCTHSNLVMNVIAKQSIGKSTMVKVAAKQIARDGKYHVFYVDAVKSLQQYFKDCGIQFDDELRAVRGLVHFIEEYYELKRAEGKRIIVIIDSPGGVVGGGYLKVDDKVIDTQINVDIRNAFVRAMRSCIINYRIHFYCVSSPPNKFFTKQVKTVLCKERYKEREQKDWIDFQLLDVEMDELIGKFEEKQKPIKFSEEEKNALKTPEKGDRGEDLPIYIQSFVKKMVELKEHNNEKKTYEIK